jgi:carbamoyl-phosphate synthase large subunit
VVKPACGSAAIGVRVAADAAQLRSALAALEDPVIEEREAGQEFTVNVLASREGELVCAVPHLRLEVRAGEVSKGRTFRHPELDRIAERLVLDLPRCRGPFNFQGFLNGDGVRLTEINARFGGGYPLAQAAGARFPEWLIREQRGEPLPRAFTGWQSDVVMLRYDQEILGRQVAPDRIEPL